MAESAPASEAGRRPSLLPREHGAWAQLLLPLVAALVAVPVHPAGPLLAAASLVAFLAQEPLRLRLGHRGRRAQEVAGRTAGRRLAVLIALGMATGIPGILWTPAAVLWTVAVPASAGLVAVVVVLRRLEKSLVGELVAALALTSCAVPVAASGGGSAPSLLLTVPLALVFVLFTFAVRLVIDHRKQPVSMMRRGALAIAAAASCGLPIASAAGAGQVPLGSPVLMVWIAIAVGPAAGAVILIAVRPPHPRYLRQVGWSLAAASTFAAVALVVGLRTAAT